MSNHLEPAQKRTHALTYVLLAITGLATLVALVKPGPSIVSETARPIMLAE